LFGGSDERPAPPHIADTGVPTQTATATAGAAPQLENPPEPAPKKKRGFWSRLFGRDRDSERSDESAPAKKKGG
jgi:hypothetical protein